MLTIFSAVILATVLVVLFTQVSKLKEKFLEFATEHVKKITHLQSTNSMLSNLLQQEKIKTERPLVLNLQDQQGQVYAFACITRADILEMTYIATNGTLQIVLATTSAKGQSALQWAEKTTIQKNEKGQFIPKPNGAFQQDMYYQMEMVHNTITVSNKNEIIKCWEYMHPDVNVNELFAFREEGLKRLALLKQEKQKEEQQKLRTAQGKDNANEEGKESMAIIKGGMKNFHVHPATSK